MRFFDEWDDKLSGDEIDLEQDALLQKSNNGFSKSFLSFSNHVLYPGFLEANQCGPKVPGAVVNQSCLKLAACFSIMCQCVKNSIASLVMTV